MRVYKLYMKNIKGYASFDNYQSCFDKRSKAKRAGDKYIGKGQYSIHTFKLTQVHEE